MNKELYLSITGKSEQDLTEDFDTMLQLAMDEISMLIAVEPIAELATLYFRKAICSQVDYYISHGMSAATDEKLTSISIGNLSKTYKNDSSTQSHISTLALRYLSHAGLMYRGVSI